MASMAPPSPPMVPPTLYGAGGVPGTTVEDNSSDGSRSSSSSSIIVLVVSMTVLVSLSVCLLLCHLNRRCLRRGLTRSSTSTVTASSAVASNRVGPEESSTTASLLDSLPLITFSSIVRRSKDDSTAYGADCAVCLSKFESEDQLRLLPCFHAFHAQCIDTWLTKSNQSQTCPLCRSPIYASESDLMKALVLSSNEAAPIRSGGSDSVRLELGSVSRRQPSSDGSADHRRIYSVGSFDYIVDEESEVTMNQTHRRNVSNKEEAGRAEAALEEASLAMEVANERSWLKEYVDRLSFTLSSRSLSVRSSGGFFTGSSRRSDISEDSTVEYDVEANRVGEEISEMFRWFSGV
ncbi:hypothetical protein PTKIN_Ptkin15bG0009400 [Pterospermum kingtungense]